MLICPKRTRFQNGGKTIAAATIRRRFGSRPATRRQTLQTITPYSAIVTALQISSAGRYDHPLNGVNRSAA